MVPDALAGLTDGSENKTLGKHLSFCQRRSLSVPRGVTDLITARCAQKSRNIFVALAAATGNLDRWH